MNSSHDYDKVLYRLLTILRRLGDGESLRTRELAKEFGVGERTIRRDMRERLNGFPVEYRDGCWCMPKGYRLEKIRRIEEELTLEVLEMIAQGMGATFGEITRSLFSKLKNPNLNPFLSRLPIEDPGAQLEAVRLIHDAIGESRLVEFDYNDKKRNVEPYGVVNFEGYWYLFGFDRRDGRFKTFYLHQIHFMRLTDDLFKPRKEAGSIIRYAINSWFEPDNPPFEARLLALPAITKYFRRRPLSPTQQIVAEHPDGSLELAVWATSIREILHEIKKWQPQLLILSPASLVQAATDMAQEFLQKQQEIFSSGHDGVRNGV